MRQCGKWVLAGVFLVVGALAARAGKLPGAGVAWPEVRLSTDQLRQEMAKVLARPPVAGLEALVSSWKERLAGQRGGRPHAHPEPFEMAMLECLLREDGFARLEGFLNGEAPPQGQAEALLAAALVTASALNRLPEVGNPGRRLVYRGEALHDRDLSDLQPGREVVEHGFSKACATRQAAEKTIRGAVIRGRHPVLLAITTRSGRLVSVKGREPIVVFLPETAFRVNDRSRRQGLTILSLEEIPPVVQEQAR